MRVNAIAPGFIETRMTDGIPGKVIDKIVARIPLMRMGTTEDIANAYLWLASDCPLYTTVDTLVTPGNPWFSRVATTSHSIQRTKGKNLVCSTGALHDFHLLASLSSSHNSPRSQLQ